MDKLNESQQWIEAEQKQAQLHSQRSQNFKINLIYFARWITSGWSGWLFYLATFGIFISFGFALGINFPSVIACRNTTGYCYLLRLDKETVVIPSDYLKKSNSKR